MLLMLKDVGAALLERLEFLGSVPCTEGRYTDVMDGQLYKAIYTLKMSWSDISCI